MATVTHAAGRILKRRVWQLEKGKERGAVFMLQLLETGKALYVLAGICVLGIMTRAITKRFYKRLIKESTNLALTKNKSLKELRQKAENTYRMNQGMSDSGAWLEQPVYAVDLALPFGRRSWSISFLLVSAGYFLHCSVRRRLSPLGNDHHAF